MRPAYESPSEDSQMVRVIYSFRKVRPSTLGLLLKKFIFSNLALKFSAENYYYQPKLFPLSFEVC